MTNIRVLFAAIVLIATSAAHGAVSGRALEPFVHGPTAGTATHASTAFVRGRFLTVWQQAGVGGGPHLFGMFLDEQGRRLSDRAFPITPLSHQARAIEIHALDDSYGVFWLDQANLVQFCMLDADAGVLRGGYVVRSQHFEFAAASNGGRFIIALRHPPGLSRTSEAIVLDRDGNILRRGIPLADDAVTLHAGPSPGGFVVLTSSWSALTAHRISLEGELSVVRMVEAATGPTTTDYRATFAASTPRPSEILIAWVGSEYGKLSKLKAAVIRADGTLGPTHVLPLDQYYSLDSIHASSAGQGFRLFFRGTRQASVVPTSFELGAISIDNEGSPQGDAVTLVPGLSSTLTFAYSSNDEVTLAVTQPRTVPAQVMAYSFSDLRPADPQVLSLTPSTQSRPRLIPASSGFTAAWNDATGSGQSVHTAAVASDGVRTSAIASVDGALWSDRIASSGSDHLILRLTAGQLIATRIDLEGKRLADVVLPASNLAYTEASAVWAAGSYVVAWIAQDKMFVARIVGDAVATVNEMTTVPSVPNDWYRYPNRLSLGFDGRFVLLVWSEGQAPVCYFPACVPPDTNAFAVRLSNHGIVLDREPTKIGPDPTGRRPLIASNGSEFVVVTPENKWDVIRADGSGLRQEVFDLVLPSGYGALDLTWSGSEYVVLSARQNHSLGISRHDRTGTPTASFLWLDAPATNDASIVAWGGRILVAAALSDVAEPPRARIFLESDFAALPATRRRSAGR